MKKMLLIDGNMLLFKSFYAAIAINKNHGNMPTHLFFNTLMEIIKNLNPNNIFIAFDAHAKTKRHLEYPEYKSKRKSPPESIYEQKQIIINILELLNIKWMEKPGDEADDLIATVTNLYKKNNEIFILSDDKDLLQLIDINVAILTKNKKTKAYDKVDTNNFFATYKLLPNQIIDYKGIAGDSSDNLKGIKGIGDKTAIELLNRYNDLEGIYQNLNDLTLAQQAKFLENKDEAFLCKKLAKLNIDVDIQIEEKDFEFTLSKIDIEKLNNYLDQQRLVKIQNNINELIKLKD